MRLMTLLGAAALLLAACQEKAATSERHVLPEGITPVHYDITVTPNAEALSFAGQVGVDIEVTKETKTVVLNATDLKFSAVRLDAAAANPAIAYDAEAQRASLTFDAPLKVGRHRLEIDYDGKISQQAFGLFRVDYDGEGGAKEHLLATQFEAPDARRFAPMWDEPAKKATFSLSVVAPADRSVYSNMPQLGATAMPGGLKKVVFAPTPKMSSYLLFLAIGDFERISKTVDGVEIGVVTRRGASEQGRFALDSAAEILPFYNDYFGVKYPLPKLDMLAIPGGATAFAAMENWGAILYFDKFMLIDPKASTEDNRRFAYTAVAHEMAHQWFGDLVTMSWWDDLWLNEGFAEWMNNKVADTLKPEWSNAASVLGDRDRTMGLDSREATHPIVLPVADPRDANFDDITYTKGQAVIGMIEDYIGPDKFRDGLRAYMREHAYGNTVSADLWSALAKASGANIDAVAADFLTRPGVPLIKVETIKGGLRLSQGRFGVDEASRAAQTWLVPVTARQVGGGEWRGLVSADKPAQLKLSGPVVVNAGAKGYFRTAYDEAAFAPLRERFAGLATIDQLQLLDDYWAFAQEGVRPVADYFALADRLPVGADPLVWRQVASTLGDIDQIYEGDPRQPAFRAAARKLLSPVWATVGWTPKPGESANVSLLRADLIQSLGDYGDPAVMAEAKARFDRMDRDPAALPGAIREAALRVVAAQADRATFDALRAKARTSKALEKQLLYAALGHVRDEALAREVLALQLSAEPPATNRDTALSALAAGHPRLTWDFLKTNDKAFDAVFAPETMATTARRIMAHGADAALAGEVRDYAAAHGGVRKNLAAALSGIDYRAKVKRERSAEIDAWVTAQTR